MTHHCGTGHVESGGLIPAGQVRRTVLFVEGRRARSRSRAQILFGTIPHGVDDGSVHALHHYQFKLFHEIINSSYFIS